MTYPTTLTVGEASSLARVRAWPLALAALVVGVGDLLVALANARSRDDLAGVALLYYIGLGLLYVGPTAAAVVLRWDRAGSSFLVALLAVGLFLVRVASTPTRLATTDEFQTLRSLNDLHRTHHLFAVNPIVGTYPRFPGSQIAVVTLHDLSGWTFSTSGKVLIGAEHVLLCLALFVLVGMLLGRSLAAYLAVVVYACNPSYVFYDAETSYESFALPLAVLVLFLLVLASRASRRDRRILTVLACVMGVVVCVSHHMTSYWLAGMMVGWTIVALARRRWADADTPDYAPWLPAVLITGFSIAWFFLMARKELVHELGPTVSGSISAIRKVLHGSALIKAPFAAANASSVFTDPFGLRLVGYLSVLIALALLAGGFWQLREHDIRRSGVVVIAALGLLYPVGLALRLTQASTETASRTSEFVFLGIGLGAALLVRPRVPAPRRTEPPEGALSSQVPPHPPFAKLRWTVAILLAVAILAVGGVVLGPAPYDRFAGPIAMGADTRSVGLLGEQTASWTATHLPPNANIFSDDTNANLIDSTGDFTRQEGIVDGIPVDDLFTAGTINRQCTAIITGDRIRYLVIDQRLAQLQSGVAYQIEVRHDGVATTQEVSQLPPANLAKFATAAGLSRIYDNGTIRIYDTDNLLGR